MSKKTRSEAPAQGDAASAPAPAPTRSRAEIGAELVALQIAYGVTTSAEALALLRAAAAEYLETFR